jgi:hypothetical protein
LERCRHIFGKIKTLPELPILFSATKSLLAFAKPFWKAQNRLNIPGNSPAPFRRFWHRYFRGRNVISQQTRVFDLLNQVFACVKHGADAMPWFATQCI